MLLTQINLKMCFKFVFLFLKANATDPDKFRDVLLIFIPFF
jgi:hypothetical protein